MLRGDYRGFRSGYIGDYRGVRCGYRVFRGEKVFLPSVDSL